MRAVHTPEIRVVCAWGEVVCARDAPELLDLPSNCTLSLTLTLRPDPTLMLTHKPNTMFDMPSNLNANRRPVHDPGPDPTLMLTHKPNTMFDLPSNNAILTLLTLTVALTCLTCLTLILALRSR